MNRKTRLLIVTQTSETYAILLRKYGFGDLEMVPCHTAEEARPHVKGCDIILGEPRRIAPLLGSAENLTWVQSTFAGVEPLMGCSMRKDYLLTNVREVFGPLMSEYVFAYVLAIERHLAETRDHQREHRWQEMPYRPLKGILLGICGLGSIGRHIARTAKHFDMKVWGFKRSEEEVACVDRVFTDKDFAAFLAQPEYVVAVLPETPKTRHLFDDRAFERMNPSAVLINVGRGSLVSEAALIRALNDHRIRGAVLDVFETEPLPETNPLWDTPDLLITPHNAAVGFPEPVVGIFADNYRRFVAGTSLRYVVDFDRGY